MATARNGSAWERFSGAFPALALAQLAVVAVALVAAAGAGGTGHAAMAVVQSLLVLLRAVPVLLLLSLPLLLLKRPRVRMVALGLLWSLFIAVQVMLDLYFQVAQVPLGADLFGYSLAEIRVTLADGASVKPRNLLAMALPLLVLWTGLLWWGRRERRGSGRGSAALLAAAGAAWLLPLSGGGGMVADVAARDVPGNTLAWFSSDVWRWATRGDAAAVAATAPLPAGTASEVPLNADYPFLRQERTPDTLGAYFSPTRDGRPPNVVLIIVEGLGRSFSGPQAALGSFTPFLDELAGRSLYFDNFLANQARTFGVLPTLIGSAPFADQGFTALGRQMPAHPGLFSVLGQQGYHTAFYNGTDTGFDDERGYMQLQQVQTLVDMKNFGPGYAPNPFSAWGYADRELVSRVLADSKRLKPPFLLAMQTISMHTSYQFPGQDAYREKFEQRLGHLQVPEARRAGYRAHADIYSTILYTDDQLRRYFESVEKEPWYANTLFIVTGDHRLPEIPLDAHIDRYHVPLIVFSPLLKQPRRVRAVSSQLDVTPSLMALLSNTYGLRRPGHTAWLGNALDMSGSFRSLHQMPLKQTKTSAPEFVAGRWWLRDGQLYELQDGMHLSPVEDAQVREWTVQRLQRYQQANAVFMQRKALLPPQDTPPALVAYSAAPAAAQTDTAPALPGLSVAAAEVVANRGTVQLTAVFSSGDPRPSRLFVPLAILFNGAGKEVQEVYGKALQLPPEGSQQVQLQLQLPADCDGRCHISVFPSDPDNGKAVGQGRYHLLVDAGTTSENLQ